MNSRSFLTAATLLVVVGASTAMVHRVRTEGNSAGTALPAKPNTVTIHAKDFAFVGPTSIPAGWTTFQLVNDGQTLHHVTLVKIGGGKTFADLMQALKQPGGPPPPWIEFVGGPNAANPQGGQSNATVDLTPGTYALVCFVDVPGGVPHFARGMARELTVMSAPAKASAPTSAPAADEVVTLSDYDFAFSRPLTAGTHTFQVHNAAAQPHELEVIQLAPGKTAGEMLSWIEKPNGPPPGSSVGGMSPIAPGVDGYFTATLAPGNYLLVCFLPDAKDGKPHLMHGMSKTLTLN